MEDKLFVCNCGREFSSQRSLNSHARFCKQYVKKSNKTSKYKIGNEYICECGKSFKNSQSFNAHLSHCDIHHDCVGTIRKKRPSESYHTRNWDNKSQEEIQEIYIKRGITYSNLLKEGKRIHPWIGRKHSLETRKKTRLSTIKYIKSLNSGFLHVRYNKNSIQFIENLNKEHGWNLQHAENGGEVEIDGYFLDGYDKQLNIVFEYDEPGHYIDKYNSILKQRDINRQNHIIEKLGCKFYRYNEAIDYLYQVN